jgi:RpiB/LacA/LacB family sugar-phosphate isomerase
MKIAIAADHGGFTLKEFIKELLAAKGHEIEDFGTDSEASVDYPDFGRPAAQSVVDGQSEGAILICGTGIGMSLTVNRMPGIRGTLCHDEYTATMARQHNDSNVLIMGGRVVDEAMAERIVTIWLETEYEGGRHQRRLDKIDPVTN